MSRHPSWPFAGLLAALAIASQALASNPPWTDLGGGIAGSAGIPVLVGAGTLAGGSAGSLTLSFAQPSAPAALFVSLSSTPAPFKGGTLLANPFVVLLPLATNGSGSVTLPWVWPTGVPAGTAVYFQFAVQDSAAVYGVSLSNGEKGIAAGDSPPPPDAYVLDFVSTAATGIGMNDAGDVIGTSYLDTGCGSFCLPPQETVVWRGGNRIVLPSVAGLSGITVRAINAQGWIVGYAGTFTVTHAVLWRPVGAGYQATDLGTLPGTNTSTAVGIDDQNRVLGWSTTTTFPPNGSPFLWTETDGMIDLSTLGYPDDSPIAVSGGGTVATIDRWYHLGDPGSVTTVAAPPSGFALGGGAQSINDFGDQGRFLIQVSGQNLAYLYRYTHQGSWQLLSPAGTGHLSVYGIGSINNALDVTGTVLSTGVIAYGPSGLAQSLASKLSPAYPGSVVTSTGPMNANGTILARVLVGNSARLVRLTPAWACSGSCLKVASLVLTADFVPDPTDPTQDHCSSTLTAHNEALATVIVTDGNGAPLANAIVSGRFLDDYWTNAPVIGTTNAAGSVSFPYTGLCGVGAIAFLVDDVTKAGYTLDKLSGVLSAKVIPQ